MKKIRIYRKLFALPLFVTLLIGLLSQCTNQKGGKAIPSKDGGATAIADTTRPGIGEIAKFDRPEAQPDSAQIEHAAPYVYLTKQSGTGNYKLFIGVPYLQGQTVVFGEGRMQLGNDNKFRYKVDVTVSGKPVRSKSEYAYKSYIFSEMNGLVAVLVKCVQDAASKISVMELTDVDACTELPSDSIAYDYSYMYIAGGDQVTHPADHPQVFIPLKNRNTTSQEPFNCLQANPTAKIYLNLRQTPLTVQSESVITQINNTSCSAYQDSLKNYITEVYWQTGNPPKKTKVAGATIRKIHASMGDPKKKQWPIKKKQ